MTGRGQHASRATTKQRRTEKSNGRWALTPGSDPHAPVPQWCLHDVHMCVLNCSPVSLLHMADSFASMASVCVTSSQQWRQRPRTASGRRSRSVAVSVDCRTESGERAQRLPPFAPLRATAAARLHDDECIRSTTVTGRGRNGMAVRCLCGGFRVETDVTVRDGGSDHCGRPARTSSMEVR